MGVDPIIGNSHTYILPEGLRTYLADLDIITLAHARNTLTDAQGYWYTAEELFLDGEWKTAWISYTRALDLNGIKLTEVSDSLMWEYNKKDGHVSASSAYDCIVDFYRPVGGKKTPLSLWHSSLPRKIGCFIWLMQKNRILTWDDLQKKGKQGAGICILCLKDEESVHHLFTRCPIWNNIRELICDFLQINFPPITTSIAEFLDSWITNHPSGSDYRYIPHHLCWVIWKSRNKAIFEDKSISVLGIFHQFLNAVKLSPARPFIKERKSKKIRKIGQAPVMIFPCGFFDGASITSSAGVGFCLFLKENHHLDFAIGIGCGTNTKAELLGLWALLKSSQMMRIPLVKIYGDSQIIINWAKGVYILTPPDLFHWCRDTKKLITSFQDLTFCHIYREHNRKADGLSKTALSLVPGYGCFSEYFDDKLVSNNTFQFF